MPLIINTNISSMIAQRRLAENTNSLQGNFERLASGYRINRASDDAAGLSISEQLRSQIRGIGQAISNSQDGLNVLSIGEGALSVITENLQRIRELTVQAANDTNGDAQRNAIKLEIEARLDDIDRIARSTNFNGKDLLNPSTATSFRIQVGPNASLSLDTIDVHSAFATATVNALSIGSVTISTNSAARAFLTEIDNALSIVNDRRAAIGAFQSRLQSAIQNLSISKENYTAAESRIRDVDVANESANLTRNQILQQASVSILSQANSSPQLALSLIQR